MDYQAIGMGLALMLIMGGILYNFLPRNRPAAPQEKQA
tara:strand:+ start:910 stop:1023 length:114 start_codon:yes stop_codon:yes gene_type:complete